MESTVNRLAWFHTITHGQHHISQESSNCNIQIKLLGISLETNYNSRLVFFNQHTLENLYV